MHFIDEAQTLVFVPASFNTWDANPNDCTMPVATLAARGLDAANAEPFHKWRNDVATGRAEVASQIIAKCEELITQGLVSSALGAPHTYPSKVIDQQNLAANVQRSTLPANASNPDWITWHMCADGSGAWMFRPHSAAQIQQVGEDLANTITLIRMANATKLAELEGLTVAELEAYTVDEGWPT